MDAVEEVKQRLSIEDVVSQYVQLKRAGRNFKGLSPFTSEKTASLMVSPEKQIWHDFSSGKGGNMFSFVMDMEGLDFKEALELLARQAGVDISEQQSSLRRTQTKEKEKLYEVLGLAAKFYQVHLTKSRDAAEYVFKWRHFTKETVLDFQIGYSPNNGAALVRFLVGKGFSEKQIGLAGLAVPRRSGASDMFRGRIMIPLCDPTGRVIGFTARILVDDPTAPKYINTPQTFLYDKSRHIFGLHQAKQAIREKGYVVLVEGNLDVISSHQAGVRQVVATAGTALTEYHLKGISRFTNDIRLAFDQDSAGLRAAERAIPIASKVGVNLSIVTLSGAKDPDELIQQSVASWQKAIEQPIYGVDWLMERYIQATNIKGGQGKREFSDQMMSIVRGLNDKVEQEHYLSKIAETIGVSTEALRTKFDNTQQNSQRTRRSNYQPEQTDRTLVDQKKVQDHLLALVSMRTELRQFLEPLTEDMMIDQEARRLLSFLASNPDYTFSKALDRHLQSIAEYIKILVLQYEELYEKLDTLELHYEASRLQAQLIQQYVKNQKKQLSNRLQNSNDADTTGLLEEVKRLDVLLRTTKGVVHD